jgi:hypothetical protein
MGRITKKGSKWLRWISIQVAQIARQHHERLGSFYERVASMRGRNKARGAVARENARHNLSHAPEEEALLIAE